MNLLVFISDDGSPEGTGPIVIVPERKDAVLPRNPRSFEWRYFATITEQDSILDSNLGCIFPVRVPDFENGINGNLRRVMPKHRSETDRKASGFRLNQPKAPLTSTNSLLIKQSQFQSLANILQPRA